MLSYVMSTIRYYPYASVVYKMAYHKFFGTSTPVATVVAQAPKQNTPVQATAAPVVATPQETIASPKAEEIDSDVSDSNEDFVWDMDLITEKLIAAIDREGIKQNLQDHIILEYIGDHTIKIITT